MSQESCKNARPILYAREGFQNRAFRDSRSLPLGTGPQIPEGIIVKPFSRTKGIRFWNIFGVWSPDLRVASKRKKERRAFSLGYCLRWSLLRNWEGPEEFLVVVMSGTIASLSPPKRWEQFTSSPRFLASSCTSWVG